MNVIRDGGNATINIPWSKYGPANNPVQTLDAIRRDLAQSINSVRAELEERTVDFGPAEDKEFDRVHQAPRGGVVTASVLATGGTMRRGICGWVAADGDSLASPQARERNASMLGAAAAQYTPGPTNTNVTGGAIAMPVRSGEFWVVTQCAGGPQNTEVRTAFHPLEIARGER